MTEYPPVTELPDTDAVGYFNENYGFMKELITTLVDSGMSFKIDLGGEMISPSDQFDNPYEPNKAFYVQMFWRRYLQDTHPKLGTSRNKAVGFSFAVPTDVENYVRSLNCAYLGGGQTPPAISYHLGDNAYIMLSRLQNAVRNLLPPSYRFLPQINAETQYNDALTANSLNQALFDLGADAIKIDYLTQWYQNAVPPGIGPSSSVPEEPRPANIDSSEYRNGTNHNKMNKCW